jgi:hypothetical protein
MLSSLDLSGTDYSDDWEYPEAASRTWKPQTEASSGPPMILKMNFNFNFKDMLRLAGQSIRTLTIGCDLDHMVGIAG